MIPLFHRFIIDLWLNELYYAEENVIVLKEFVENSLFLEVLKFILSVGVLVEMLIVTLHTGESV